MCNCIDEDDDDDSKKKKKKQSTGDSKQVACGQSNLATYVVSLLRVARLHMLLSQKCPVLWGDIDTRLICGFLG